DLRRVGAVRREGVTFADGGHGEHGRQVAREVDRAAVVAGRDHAGHAHRSGLIDLPGHGLREGRAAQAGVHHVDAVVDAVIQGFDQVAETAAGEDLAGVHLGLDGEPEHARAVVGSAHDARAVGAVAYGVHRPAAFLPVHQVDPFRHLVVQVA